MLLIKQKEKAYENNRFYLFNFNCVDVYSIFYDGGYWTRGNGYRFDGGGGCCIRGENYFEYLT